MQGVKYLENGNGYQNSRQVALARLCVWHPLCIYGNWISWALLGAYTACQLIVNHVSSRILPQLLLLSLRSTFWHPHTHTRTHTHAEVFSCYMGNLLGRVWTTATAKGGQVGVAEHVSISCWKIIIYEGARSVYRVQWLDEAQMPTAGAWGKFELFCT